MFHKELSRNKLDGAILFKAFCDRTVIVGQTSVQFYIRKLLCMKSLVRAELSYGNMAITSVSLATLKVAILSSHIL